MSPLVSDLPHLVQPYFSPPSWYTQSFLQQLDCGKLLGLSHPCVSDTHAYYSSRFVLQGLPLWLDVLNSSVYVSHTSLFKAFITVVHLCICDTQAIWIISDAPWILVSVSFLIYNSGLCIRLVLPEGMPVILPAISHCRLITCSSSL
jgi:hypothetical protein